MSQLWFNLLTTMIWEKVRGEDRDATCKSLTMEMLGWASTNSSTSHCALCSSQWHFHASRWLSPWVVRVSPHSSTCRSTSSWLKTGRLNPTSTLLSILPRKVVQLTTNLWFTEFGMAPMNSALSLKTFKRQRKIKSKFIPYTFCTLHNLV